MLAIDGQLTGWALQRVNDDVPESQLLRRVEQWKAQAFFLERRNKDLEEKRKSEVSILKQKYEKMLEGKTEKRRRAQHAQSSVK